MSELSNTQIAERLQHLTTLSIALNDIKNVKLLLERILQTAKNITNADGGTFYRVSADKTCLEFDILINSSLSLHYGGSKDKSDKMRAIPLSFDNGEPNLDAVVAFAANRKESVNIEHVYDTPIFNFSGMRRFDEVHDYHCQSLLAVPMLDHNSELVGVLQLINSVDCNNGQIQAFDMTDQLFIEALSSQAAIAITNQDLILQLENLLESLVNLINIGIDEKSANTGRHCQQVPKLTMMLADAVQASKEGPLKDFSMSENERYELWLAGMLHDCGKITTPVHVIEKATKLQTIFDRIDLIDSRFEILGRDAEIRYLKQVIEAGKSSQLVQALQDELERFNCDRAFLAHANIGCERMQDEDLERVMTIANESWIDYLGETQPLLTENEVENLMIRAGTLTGEERKIINNHISVTIRMLEALPWPKNLQDIPEYAGGHHERMDGKGYPRGLCKEQMSVQARVMAIADIFEALTAKDRPYKTGKTLTESLRILGRFSLNGHIDPDLFRIFVSEKVYLKYAHEFMDSAQIDDVDESQIPGYLIQ
ncbi:GAF domain-containing protein [Shewanella eurypsychrophilus]|uniref:GAF domain-containing protein n=1 Tax=Shewanella eurypsychrophilus TaxID=2593656 RepID=A0ABX6V9I8_9GAMM|nr:MULTISPECIES: HD family phosphohydrolase [Shewanella]QFU24135.1 GAF domain-containing protein [Shewanella sp. YLB-09]QPG59342.1 GAF domain-containing protein [Shewanella eurypsychrophilus]